MSPVYLNSQNSAGISISFVFPFVFSMALSDAVLSAVSKQEHGIPSRKDPEILLYPPAMPLWMLWIFSSSCSPLW